MSFDTLRDFALLFARACLGVVFVAHGWQKFFQAGLDSTAAQFAGFGVPQPEVTAAIIAGIELIAGAALILGLLTPLAGVLLAIDMLGAFYFVHATHGPFVTQGGWELVVALCAGVVLLATVGAGRYSLDHVLGG